MEYQSRKAAEAARLQAKAAGKLCKVRKVFAGKQPPRYMGAPRAKVYVYVLVDK